MNEKHMLIGIAVVALVVLAFGVYSALNINFTLKYQGALQAELEDICTTPPGYTDEQWREHMGHHPDRYADCLGR